MKRVWLLAYLVACGGAKVAPTTITTPQDYERVAAEVVDRIHAIFSEGGINCNMISGDLRSLNGSQKLEAARAWRAQHPESGDAMKAAISARRAELDKVMAPASRQCEGPIQRLVGELTE